MKVSILGNEKVSISGTEAYSELSRISKVEFFVKIVNGFKPITNFPKISILDAWLRSECTSEA